MKLGVERVRLLQGDLRVPSDKSLTHRAYMFAAIANGQSVVRTPLRGEDCESTLRCLAQMGLQYEWLSNDAVRLSPSAEWQQPSDHLDCGNSGTTMRLLSGLIASRPLTVTMVGDASLSRRPMKRVAEPLRLMGASVQGETPPLTVRGQQLMAIDYRSPVASAQIKSCILLAGLLADGTTTVTEPSLSRDHTERMLRATGVSLTTEGTTTRLVGHQQPSAFEFSVPSDISSAAFLMVGAAILPGSHLCFRQVSVNPTRTGLLDVFDQAGVNVQRLNTTSELGEPVADLDVLAPQELRPFVIDGPMVPTLIDEIPVLAVLASQCQGTSVIRGAAELRVKESDRIELVANGLRAMGVSVETFADGMAITGPTQLNGAVIETHGDHRIGMAFATAGLVAEGSTTIEGAEAIATSYPSFEADLRSVVHV